LTLRGSDPVSKSRGGQNKEKKLNPLRPILPKKNLKNPLKKKLAMSKKQNLDSPTKKKKP